MDLLAAGIALAAFALAVVGAILGIVAVARIGKLERKLESIERARASGAERRPDPSSAAATAMSAEAPIGALAHGVSPVDAQPAETQPFREPAARAPEVAPTPTPWPAPTARAAPEPAVPPFLSADAAARADAISAASAEPAASPTAAAAAFQPDPPPPAPIAKSFDLERWLGVRGAAVLGGVFLAIAGFLFVQNSIERGWITPRTRVIAAALGGLACFLASSRLRRRGYAITASALAGAGAVILYAASWAASMLYGFVTPLLSFAAMGLVTAACVFVAWKHGTQLVAVLGLVGGFATPLVLSTGHDRPIGLFGYVLLLDLAFLFLAGRRRWPAIGLVALLGTTVIQGVWIVLRMDPNESWIGLGMLGVFALTFAGFATARQLLERKGWIAAQTGAVLLPFAFVLYFAQKLELAIPLGALALLAAILCAAAGVLARRDSTPWLSTGAAAGAVALLFTWSNAQRAPFDASTAWLVAGCALGLVALQHAFAEWRRADGSHAPGTVAGAATSAMGTLVLAAYAALDPGSAHPWPWIACFAAIALVLHRQAALSQHVDLAWIGSCGVGAAFALQRLLPLGALRFDRDIAILAAVAGTGAMLLLAVHRRRLATRQAAFASVAAYFVIAMIACCDPQVFPGVPFLAEKALAIGAVLVMAVGALAAATGARSGVCFLAAALVAFVAQAVHIGVEEVAGRPEWSVYLGLLALTTIVFAVWPLATRERWRTSALAWCTAAFQPLARIFPIAALVETRYGPAFEFVTPLVFAAGTGLFSLALWRVPAETDDEAHRVQRRARIAATLTALLCASSVLPIYVDREPLALTLAIFGAAASVLWARVDSLAVKFVAIAAILAALVHLVLLPGPWSFEVPPRPIANVNAWLYLVPAACAVFASSRLRTHERERARGFELGLIGNQQPIGAAVAGFAAVVLVFVWLNVEIAGWFAIGERGGLDAPHERGRALATSLAWAVYALVLLTLGVVRRASGPRWASLVLFLAMIAKVFLFDLGHLAGLQRAASMLGLALSLIVVSLVYQRFVFRRAAAPDAAPSAPAPSPSTVP